LKKRNTYAPIVHAKIAQLLALLLVPLLAFGHAPAHTASAHTDSQPAPAPNTPKPQISATYRWRSFPTPGSTTYAHIVGVTTSSGFSHPSGYDASYNGGSDAFVVKLAPATSGTGSLKYGSFFGGAADDWGFAIAADTNGRAYITGATESSTFPTLKYYDNTYNGGRDAFVASFNLTTTGSSSFVYSSFFGGSTTDQAEGIAVNTSGSSAWVSITGWTYSSDFPSLSATPLQTSLSGPGDAFVARFYPIDGNHLNVAPATMFHGTRSPAIQCAQ
jgi:hypothetical protein